MGKREKLIERFLRQPKDFTFDEMITLLGYYGFEKHDKGKTSGSRVMFKNKDSQAIMLHKPHPGNIVKSYAMRQVKEYLQDVGLIK